MMTIALFFNLKLISLLLLTFLAFPSAGYASESIEVQIGAAKDNTLYESATGSLSNGSGEHFFVGQTAAGGGFKIRRGLIAFNIASNIPAGATIQSAVLTLSMNRTISGNQTVSLHKLTADWGEGTSDAPGGEGQGAAATTNDATWLHRFYISTYIFVFCYLLICISHYNSPPKFLLFVYCISLFYQNYFPK